MISSTVLQTLFVLWLSFSSCQAWSDEFAEVVAKGRTRLRDITNAVTSTTQTDTSRSCVMNQWKIANLGKKQITQIGSPSYLPTINALGNLGLDAPYEVHAGYPESFPTSDYDNYYDWKAGAIVFASNGKNGRILPPLSLADVVAILYRSIGEQEDGHAPTDIRNLQYLVHTDVQSDGAEDVCRDLWAAASREDRGAGKVVYTDMGSDEVLAILGLPNGAVESGLLRYHNVELGKKMLYSLTLAREVNLKRSSSRWHFWWTLRSADDAAFASLRSRQCQSTVLGVTVNCFTGQTG